MSAAVNTLAAAARSYAARGLRVHPLRPGSKLPLLPRWQLCATTDPRTIDKWFSASPPPNVAIAAGMGSGEIVLDIDPRHGGDETRHDLECEHGESPDTWRCLAAYVWKAGFGPHEIGLADAPSGPRTAHRIAVFGSGAHESGHDLH